MLRVRSKEVHVAYWRTETRLPRISYKKVAGVSCLTEEALALQ